MMTSRDMQHITTPTRVPDIQISRQRQQDLNQWLVHQHSIRHAIAQLQQGWKDLATSWCQFPLAFRRDLNLGLCKERFCCAALLDHVQFMPQAPEDPRVSRLWMEEQFDPLLCAREQCPKCHTWLQPLLEAAWTVFQFDHSSSDELNVPELDRRLAEAMRNYEAASAMVGRVAAGFRKVADMYKGHLKVRPSLAATAAWNRVCSAIQDGLPVEHAAKAFPAEPYELSGPMTEGNVRSWFDYDVPLPGSRQ